jgi:hypothetical protein
MTAQARKVEEHVDLPLLRKKDLQHLLERADGDLCVTITMPVSPGRRGIDANNAAWRDVLHTVENKFQSYGVDADSSEAVLKQLRSYLDAVALWLEAEDGLAVFVTPDNMQTYTLPFAPENRVVVDKRFYLRNFLPSLEQHERFFILALNREGAHLLHCNESTYTRHDAPADLSSYSGYTDNYELGKATLKSHDATDAARGMHGEGATGGEARKTYLDEWLKKLENWARDVIDNTGEPLMLAGDDEITGHFRALCHYRRLSAPTLAQRNIADVGDEELHRLGVRAAREDKRARIRQALGEYERLSATAPARTSKDIGDILNAARDQRVATLFLRRGAHIWGHYDAKARHTELKQSDDAYVGEELGNLAALHTVRNHGDIVILGADVEADFEVIAAIYRW